MRYHWPWQFAEGFVDVFGLEPVAYIPSITKNWQGSLQTLKITICVGVTGLEPAKPLRPERSALAN